MKLINKVVLGILSLFLLPIFIATGIVLGGIEGVSVWYESVKEELW